MTCRELLLFVVLSTAMTVHAAQPENQSTREAIDFCSIFDKATVEDVVGEPLTMHSFPASESRLGICRYYEGEWDTTIATVAGKPADEFTGVLETVKNGGITLTKVSGLEGIAYNSDYGLFIQPPGAPYFLIIVVSNQVISSPATCMAPSQKMQFELAEQLGHRRSL